jgi:RNA-directed DNA polymerase
MKTFNNLYPHLYTYQNLKLAFMKARKKKTLKDYVIKFEENLEDNLLELRNELIFHTYKPKPLEHFILRDPKTRKISKSAFRDRIVHHALCNIITPILEKDFIYDSYANRVGKGTFKAVKRFDYFAKKMSKNHTKITYALKIDIKHYFENVDHDILISIIKRKIKDQRIFWLIKIILNNYKTQVKGKGMPLGNLTSQFFANVYLNELDQFVKHKLRVKYYVRYVDDFVILHNSKKLLEEYKTIINRFLQENLFLQAHSDKSKIILLQRGIGFLGLRIFPYYKLLKKKNLGKFEKKLRELLFDYDKNLIYYDQIYDFLEGWCAYARNANTYKLRERMLEQIEEKFVCEISTKEINRYLKEVKNITITHI